MRKSLIALPLALALLSGCQGVSTELAVDGCTGYNKLMPVMTALNRADKLSAAQRKTVSYVRATVGKEICEQPAPPTDAELVQFGIRAIVDGGVAAPKKIQTEVK